MWLTVPNWDCTCDLIVHVLPDMDHVTCSTWYEFSWNLYQKNPGFFIPACMYLQGFPSDSFTFTTYDKLILYR